MDQHLCHLLLDYNKKYLLLETHLYHSCLDPDCLPHINEELDINHSVFVMRDTVIALDFKSIGSDPKSEWVIKLFPWDTELSQCLSEFSFSHLRL